jgi:membrane AbrB-like protein
MGSRERSQPRAVVLVLAVTIVLSVAFTVVGLPSAVLFAALIGGMSHALSSRTVIRVPPRAFRLGQAIIGVTIGSLVSISALGDMGTALLPILLVTLGTVLVSLVAGAVLAIRDDVSRVTGAFAMIAGGASGVVAIARELGADDRVVTVVQYLRVLVVLVTMPVVTALVFHPDHGQGRLELGSASLGADLAFVAIALVLGVVVARIVPITTAALLGPLVIAAAVSSTGWLGTPSVPPAVQ